MIIKKNHKASIRIQKQNPNHHLFNNNGTWWLHYTVYPTAITSERRRLSLGTRDVRIARERRNRILSNLFQEPACKVG